MPFANSLRVPSSRKRHTVSKRAPLSDAQKKVRSAASRKRQEDIDDTVREWKASTLTLAKELARRFNKKERYFLDLFFQSGVHLVRKQTKVNAHNAFLSMKAQELRESASSHSFSSYLLLTFLSTSHWPQTAKPRHYLYSIPRNSSKNTISLTRLSALKSLPHTKSTIPIASAQLHKHVPKMSQRLFKLSVIWYVISYFPCKFSSNHFIVVLAQRS